MKKLQHVLVGGLAIMLLVTATPAPVHASSNSEELAELYALLAVLQAQLAALQNGGTVTSGAPRPTDNADVNIMTGSADRAEDDAVELEGELDFDGEKKAKVWFEYGTTYAMAYSTPTLSLTRSGSDDEDFSIIADDIDSNRTYYYRAVAEDTNGDYAEGIVRSFKLTGSYDDDNDDDYDNDEDTPDVETGDAEDINGDEASINGEVDMNDADDGYVFFVWGEDEDMIEDASDESEYDDIDSDSPDLIKTVVDTSLDGSDDYYVDLYDLDSGVDYYFRLCVEYEDEDDDLTLECGDVESFEADGDSNDNDSDNDEEAPDVETGDAKDIDEDEARVYGEVDMNDANDGYVFFVWGEDEDMIEDASDESEYDDIDSDSPDLIKTVVDTSLDGSDDYYIDLYDLDSGEDYYYRICVEYEDEDDDLALMCGSVESFETDN